MMQRTFDGRIILSVAIFKFFMKTFQLKLVKKKKEKEREKCYSFFYQNSKIM